MTITDQPTQIIEQKLNELVLDYSDCYYLLTDDNASDVITFFRDKALNIKVINSFLHEQAGTITYLMNYCEKKNIPQIDFYRSSQGTQPDNKQHLHIFTLV